MTRLTLTVLSHAHLNRMRPDRLATVAAKDHANAMVRKHAVCRTLFKWRHTHSAHLNTFDLFLRTNVVVGGVAILGNR